MQRYDAPTIRAGPLLAFFGQILLGSHRLEPQGISNEADLVALPVAFVKTFEYGAGKGGAAGTKVEALLQRASLDFALPAMFGLGLISSSTSPTGLFLFQVRIAYRAVHSTGS